mgnify:CR=1 FL=1
MISTNTSLKPYNTFGIDATCAQFSTFSSTEELRRILAEHSRNKLLVLGGGSNILLTQNFDGLVVKNEIMGFDVVEETDQHAIVKAGAGEVWHEFVLKCIDRNFGGVENLSLIPGSVGASPMQNIGAYGVEIKDVFVQLEAYHIASGNVEVFNHQDCEFGYRESVFKRKLKDQYIITSVTFKLTKQHQLNTSYGAIEAQLQTSGIKEPTIKDVSDAVIAIRSSKLPDPKQIGNAGSFFKNPVVEQSVLTKIQATYENVPNYPASEGKVKLAAGWLIDQAGWKGKTFDTYGVHKLQALVLVNYGNCTGRNIYDLSGDIIRDIQEKFGVNLEREVNII